MARDRGGDVAAVHYKGLVDQHIKPGIGSVPLQKATGGHLNKLYSNLLLKDRKNGKGGLFPRTVRYVHAVVHRAFRDAVRWNRLPRNPADAADPPKLLKKPIKRWAPSELRSFLERMATDRLYTAYLLIATTGMRRGECSDCAGRTSTSRPAGCRFSKP